jgi:hypothetical protein
VVYIENAGSILFFVIPAPCAIETIIAATGHLVRSLDFFFATTAEYSGPKTCPIGITSKNVRALQWDIWFNAMSLIRVLARNLFN